MVSKIDLTDITNIVVFDDDRSIHEMWRARIPERIKIESCHSIEEFESILNLKLKIKSSLFLIDYDLQENINGVEIIKQYMFKNSILVTSTHISKIESICESHGIKMIPKNLVPYIKLVP